MGLNSNLALFDVVVPSQHGHAQVRPSILDCVDNFKLDRLLFDVGVANVENFKICRVLNECAKLICSLSIADLIITYI